MTEQELRETWAELSTDARQSLLRVLRVILKNTQLAENACLNASKTALNESDEASYKDLAAYWNGNGAKLIALISEFAAVEA